jgi:type IV secretory pathway VirB9-like protein|tara:strand:- start:504 stop:731 length:228 start_codon:yes stop_codon:yes gene_type:complete
MSNINITQNKNTVTVNGETRVVTVKTAGPQGAGFDLTLDHSAKVDNSVMYYQASSGKLILDDNVTKLKLVNGGNF